MRGGTRGRTCPRAPAAALGSPLGVQYRADDSLVCDKPSVPLPSPPRCSCIVPVGVLCVQCHCELHRLKKREGSSLSAFFWGGGSRNRQVAKPKTGAGASLMGLQPGTERGNPPAGLFVLLFLQFVGLWTLRRGQASCLLHGSRGPRDAQSPSAARGPALWGRDTSRMQGQTARQSHPSATHACLQPSAGCQVRAP